MQVKMGEKNFIKTKFDGLDGKTTVAFESEDEMMVSKANQSEMEFTIKIKAHSHQELTDAVATFGPLMDETFKEFAKLSKCATSKIIR